MSFNSHRVLLVAVVLSTLAVALFSSQFAAAQDVLRDISVEYVFGGPVTFSAEFDPQEPPLEALVLFRIQGENNTLINPAEITENSLEYIHDQAAYALRPFTRVEYWFQLTYPDGRIFTSPENLFIYEDNRYEWKTLSREPFHVHWYDGDTAFAQGILDVAHEGLKKAHSIIQLPDPQNIQIYVYASAEELQATRRLSRREGVAGHAEVDLSVMVVSLPNLPERRLETERQVPHELMHILLYQATERGYENIPTWLNEGLASVVELYPNPDYQAYLESAVISETLIPFSSLCSGFPLDVSDFILSYAQSAYFTRYLYRTYGSTSMESLLENYVNGLDCERGFEAAYGVNLATMEKKWLKESFALNPVKEVEAAAASTVLPWFALFVVIVALPIAAVLPGLFKSKKMPGG
jgi:hypothetical protein